MAQPAKITYSPEICDLLALAHSIARLKKQVFTYDNQTLKNCADDCYFPGKIHGKKPALVHTDAQLRAQRKAIEDKIISILKPLDYPMKDGWVKYIETSSKGHDVLQKSDINKLIATMRGIETGYRTIISMHKEMRDIKRDIASLRRENLSIGDKLHDSYKRASTAASMLSHGYGYEY